MLILAERLRIQNGGSLDESAIQAVAEATGAPAEYVRLAVKLRSEKHKPNIISSARAQYLTLDPDTRRYVAAGITAVGVALMFSLDRKASEFTQVWGSNYGIFAMFGMLILLAGAYNVAISRETRVAAICGAIVTSGWVLMKSIFGALLMLKMKVDATVLIPASLLGCGAGVALQKLFVSNRARLGLKDPVEERQELLAQLHDLRERLNEGERTVSFLSVDIVGSTRLKQMADPLAVEFTLNEYHQFVERISRQYGGRVHSTAGDGVISAFDNPQQAFGAARNLQASMLELNTLRNKIGVPIVVRCGIHTGSVVAPDASDVTTLDFSEVIDIAAHLQKISPAGGIAVSEYSTQGLIGGANAVGAERTSTEGVNAVIWTPKAPPQKVVAPSPQLPEPA